MLQYLQHGNKRLSAGTLKREWDSMQKIHRKGAQEIRSAINEVSQSKGR